VPSTTPHTIRHLLTHTSDIPTQRPAELENITRTFDRTLAEDVSLVAQQPLDFAPGSSWEYSSSGFAVFGRVIEVVSGQPYDTFVDRRIFRPLAMRDGFLFTDPKKLGSLMYNNEAGHLVKDTLDVARPQPAVPRSRFWSLFDRAGSISLLSDDVKITGPYKATRCSRPASRTQWFIPWSRRPLRSTRQVWMCCPPRRPRRRCGPHDHSIRRLRP
jgi:CubicO group peptidase (beta-lactamase class C family)